ncbi:diaminopimelate epimerase [Alkalicoccus urumqiensis]|uniref:diaminopimelate epimerase n=1 Tax=Alkalicoccus urumqiensis TaxID=1548213 RepID=UPI0015E5E886|nr:diaminopimelate epimerase [Alkalicoccus urumqiensis]
MQLEFIKVHGSKNDFVLIDEMEGTALSEEQLRDISRELSRRDGAIGSDGLLAVLPSTSGDAQMRMFNSDGSEAEMCGNGLRCAARYAAEKLGREELVMETMKADLNCAKVPDVFDGVQTYEVAIEPVSLVPQEVPINREKDVRGEVLPELKSERRFTALSVPNPHLVTIVDAVDDEEVEEVGRRANEASELMPNGTNVSFVQILDDHTIFVRTYERGVGLTNACGTAMSASTLTAVLHGHVPAGDVITVINRGGMVQTVVLGEERSWRIRLRGNATVEGAGTVLFHEDGRAELIHYEEFEDEQDAYSRMVSAASASRQR